MNTDIYVARQPIFNRNMKLYGYELLYRKTHNNFYEGSNDEQATTELIYNSFLVIEFDKLVDGKRGFINFSKELLLKDVPLLLPKEKVVIEILERVEVTDEVVEKCKELKSKGYLLALDDFVLDKDGGGCTRLIEYADIIKVEFSNVPVQDQIELISKYKSKITFLAERVETRQEYQQTIKLGYTLFQGFFFSKPMMVNAKQIGALDMNVSLILEELQKVEPDFKVISDIIEKDLGLSYKLLKIANSVYFNVKAPIKSIHHALVVLGTKEMIGWVQLMLFKGVTNEENEELIRTSVIRGKLLSLLAVEVGHSGQAFDCFLTGILSSIDVILNQDMKGAIGGLSLTQEVRDTLLGSDTALKPCLDAIHALEEGRWDDLDREIADKNILQERFMFLYVQALQWQQSMSV